MSLQAQTRLKIPILVTSTQHPVSLVPPLSKATDYPGFVAEMKRGTIWPWSAHRGRKSTIDLLTDRRVIVQKSNHVPTSRHLMNACRDNKVFTQGCPIVRFNSPNAMISLTNPRVNPRVLQQLHHPPVCHSCQTPAQRIRLAFVTLESLASSPCPPDDRLEWTGLAKTAIEVKQWSLVQCMIVHRIRIFDS